MLRIITEHVADTTILHCFGRVVAGPEADSLKDAVAGEAGKRLVMIDLSGVDAIDARGLGLLVFLQTLGNALGFDLQLTNPGRHVREVLDLTRLDSVLEISSSEDWRGESGDTLPPGSAARQCTNPLTRTPM